MLRAILTYRRAFHGRPSPCRFFPTCSEYGYDAIALHGAGRGGWLTARRLLRCRPFGPSGFDPVPDPPLSGPCVDRDHDSPTMHDPRASEHAAHDLNTPDSTTTTTRSEAP